MIALLLCTWLAQAGELDLEAAYQREFAYLQAEKEALAERREGLEASEGRRAEVKEAEIGQLQGRLLALQSERAELEEALSAARRDSEGALEAADRIDATLYQARTTLGAIPEAGDPADQADALRQAFVGGAERLEGAAAFTSEVGSFFLADGTRVDGTVVRLGNVAAWGVSPQGAGTLVPVGEDRLQLQDRGAETARALADGAAPAALDLFLFEGEGKRIEEAPPKTVWTVLRAGGLVGYVILGLGLVALGMVLLRALTLWRVSARPAFVDGLLARVADGRLDEARAVAASAGTPVGRVVLAVLAKADHGRSAVEDAAGEAILREMPAIERFGTAITMIAAVSPLLGLLGTVTGMIGTFDIITEFGTGDPRMLSGGISEALVTTQFGLIVAIPALLAGNLLQRAADRVSGGLEVAALGAINRLPAVVTEDEDTLVHGRRAEGRAGVRARSGERSERGDGASAQKGAA